MSLRSILPLLFLAAVTACAAAPATPAPQPRTSVRLDPPVAVDTAPLPNLTLSSAAIAEGGAHRLQSLTAVDQPVGVVVRELATKFGLQYNIDPAVHGTVNANLRNATLAEALSAVVPQGAMYEIRDGVLRVGPARVDTRIFSLDYVALSRVGTASTVIQRRLPGVSGMANPATGAVPAAAAGLGASADAISAVSVADVWAEIAVAVEALVFDSASASTARDLGGSGAYSRVGEGGRRLIVNPIAGTITVSATPQRLDQVEQFIRAFEASVQRQVLIEAKIVEVNLDRNFEFGIDWNVVAKNQSVALSSGPSRTSNVEFTLKAGGTQISAVLTALESQGDVHVLSSPRVSALNNQRAIFDVTTGQIVFNVSRQPIIGPNGTVTGFTETVTPTQVNVGIVLDVLPQIGADNTVTMNVRPVVTTLNGEATYTTADGAKITAPVIDTRETDTMARLRAGETVIIGGLMHNRREKVRSGVPILRSIPLLGLAFSRRIEVEQKAELVIFLTPTIIAGQPPAAR